MKLKIKENKNLQSFGLQRSGTGDCRNVIPSTAVLYIYVYVYYCFAYILEYIPNRNRVRNCLYFVGNFVNCRYVL